MRLPIKYIIKLDNQWLWKIHVDFMASYESIRIFGGNFMKKVLFLIHDLGPGGAEKVLVNLVNNMDKEQYDITLMSLFDTGVNRQYIDPQIHYKYCFKKMFRGNSHIMKFLAQIADKRNI